MIFKHCAEGKLEEEERATACQNEFPIHPSRHHHSFFFRIEAARRLRLLPASTTTTAVSRSFCLSKVEKATFVMVCIGDRREKKESGLNATSSRALESYDYWLSYQHREEKTSHESRHVLYYYRVSQQVLVNIPNPTVHPVLCTTQPRSLT